MDKIQSYRLYRAISGVAWVFALVIAFGAVRSVVIGNKRDLGKQSIQKAEGLAYQILQIQAERQKIPSTSGGRGPASAAGTTSTDWTQWRSEGEIGRDPWGDPYRYKLTKSDAGGGYTIQVWSKNSDERVTLKSAP